MNTKYYLSLAVLVLLLVFGLSTLGQVPQLRLQQNYITGLSRPLFLTHAGDGSRRLFIVQQRGLIKVVQPGSTTPTDFLDLSGVVSQDRNERGLLGLAFHPHFETNRSFFVYYTRETDGAIEIAEYQTMASDPNRAESPALRIIITIPHAANTNHNGGTIAFGPDGYLYFATGDGGGTNDPANNAQNINSLLGKFLRIDINTPLGQMPPYNSPGSNPYSGPTVGADEIYAIGLRNPYRFSIDRGGLNELWVGDVGQNAIEEVDTINRGGNYGWRVYEGNRCTDLDPALCISANFVAPVFQYSSEPGESRCSVTGGYVYRGNQNALPLGSYVYGDYCTGEILLWHENQQMLLNDTDRFISSFGEDESGELYVVGLSSGTVDRIIGNKSSADFDGDARTDVTVFRPSTGYWYTVGSANGALQTKEFGVDGDIPTPEDYDGDRKTDLAVFRPTTGTWYYARSTDGNWGIIRFGLAGDIPAAGDYDGDSKADLAVFRPSTGVWYILRSSDGGVNILQFGLNGDKPTPGDFDGDGKYDVAVYRPSEGTWYRLNSADGSFTGARFGLSEDIPTQSDFDGDGKTDIAVFRPSTGVWFVLVSSDGSFRVTQFGIAGDFPVAGDYDGDGEDDIAVWRPSQGLWYVLQSSDGSVNVRQLGSAGDLPAPRFDGR
ncbi:MAG: PQQ-dependent sugar dehydrogenase [Pyrinomonadaceae bacterium]